MQNYILKFITSILRKCIQYIHTDTQLKNILNLKKKEGKTICADLQFK